MIGLVKKLIAAFSSPKFAGPPKRILRVARETAELISTNARWSNEILEATGNPGETCRLVELTLNDLEQCMLGLRFEMSSSEVVESVYPEIWVRVDGFGEYFSKGYNYKLSGTNTWISCELPFYLKANQKAQLLKLNLVFEGSGSASLRNIELYSTPLA